MQIKRGADKDIDASSKRSCESSTSEAHMSMDQHVNSITSLQMLPVEILETIFGYISQSDLLQVCLTSKKNYSLACKRLYGTISMVYKDFLEDLEPLSYPSDYFSLVFLENREKLLTTVTNNKTLAALIQSFTIADMPGDGSDDDRIPGFSEFLEKLLPQLQLTSFHYKDDLEIERIVVPTVQSMTCNIRHWLHVNLVELRVVYEEDVCGAYDFEALACEFLEYNIHQTLRKLDISYRSTDPGRTLSHIPREDDDSPSWEHFFIRLAAEGIQLNLTAFGLKCDFWTDSADDSGNTVAKVVQLSKLQSLDVAFSRYIHTHGEPYHEEGVLKFLMDVTKNCPSLKQLTVGHNARCTVGELRGFICVLRDNLPHQLEELRVSFYDQTDTESEYMELAILEYQRNLVKLKFSHCPSLYIEKRRVFSGIPCLRDVESDCIDERDWRALLVPRILAFDQRKPILRQEMVSTIKEHKKKILDFLASDTIYNAAASKLPLLTDYHVVGLDIDMKERCIIANDERISLVE